jgi:hypothetical protein
MAIHLRDDQIGELVGDALEGVVGKDLLSDAELAKGL